MSDTLPCDECGEVFWSSDVARVTVETVEDGEVVDVEDLSLCRSCKAEAEQEARL